MDAAGDRVFVCTEKIYISVMLVLITIICQVSTILLIFWLLNIYSATWVLGRFSSFVSKMKKKISFLFPFYNLQHLMNILWLVESRIPSVDWSPIQFSVFSIIMSGCEICLLLWILRSIGNIIQVMAPILAKIENLLSIQEREHPGKEARSLV